MEEHIPSIIFYWSCDQSWLDDYYTINAATSARIA